MEHVLFYAMPIVFILGIIGIALEDNLKINKSAMALTMCITLWGLLLLFVGISDGSGGFSNYLEDHPKEVGLDHFKQLSDYVSTRLIESLGDVSQTLFFVLCSMLIITLIDKYGGFNSVIKLFQVTTKRKLFVATSILAFCFSAFLDNLAASILILAILNKLIPDHTDRMKFACMAIIACNAGGSWTPVGDVTVLLLWMGGRTTLWGQVSTVFIPAVVNLVVPMLIAYFTLFEKNAKLRVDPNLQSDRRSLPIPDSISRLVFVMGFLGIALVPIWQLFFNIPPFLGVIIGLTVLWLFGDIYLAIRKRRTNEEIDLSQISVVNVLKESDMATFFYFTGILMSVAALVTGGQLAAMQSVLDTATNITPSKDLNSFFLSVIIGFISSFTDNVALVAAVLGVYPVGYQGLPAMACDGSFWTSLAYCSVTGGSLMIIGSATGVTVMGLQKVSFGYYFKRFSPLALAGYLAGAATLLVQSFLIK